MAAKTSAEVVIDGKVYTLSGYEGELSLIHISEPTRLLRRSRMPSSA